MKTSQQHGIKQHKNRWLMTSAVALTLGTVGLTTEVAQADTTSDTPDVTGQTEAANQSTTNQVNLTTSQPTTGSATE
ncbi:hypothetical protein [Levilactobacillus brevis]|uniref:hypothetical protein n=1 Tax=Levilactobacillus brevis TaxID=1580 RepID=UPI001BDE0D05|nr:hypothetical protein [Levilactobacillus brevis]